MIPKIVHYIWFGGKPFPEKVQYCIESWKKHLPDYEFKLWNEDSFDVDSIPFTREAYEHKKWAFVSDYVRLYALSSYGGWYLDTDVEVLRPLTPFLDKRMVLGTDEGGYLTATMAAEANHPFWNEMLSIYHDLHFVNSDGSLNQEVNNTYLQDTLAKYGYVIANRYQLLRDGIEVFPDDYFHVMSLTSGKEHKTANSYTIHWHTLLWVNRKTRVVRFLRMNLLVPLLGAERYSRITNSLKIWLRRK